MDISKSVVLQKIYELSLAIEKCGASQELTHASVLCGELSKYVEDRMNEYLKGQ